MLNMKKLLAVGVVMFIIAGFVNSSQASTVEGYDIDKAKYVLKAGHVLAENHPYHQSLLYMDEYLCKATNGELRIEVYPNSQLGNERDLQEGCSMGTVDIGIGATATLSNFTKDFTLFDLPYLFTSKQEARSVLHGDWAQQKLAELKSLDMIGLTFWEAGMFDIMQQSHPVTKMSEFPGLTIRVMENDVFIKTMVALGINPVPMAWSEVFTSIQNGTVDGTSNPPVTLYTSSIQSIAKYFTVANMIYSPIPVIMSKITYDGLPAEYQALMYEAAEAASAVEYKLIDEMEKEAFAAFKEAGVEVTYFTEEQIAECKELMQDKVWPQFVGSSVSQDDIDAINKIVAGL
ncbi:TRAP transporter substrate-binding protein DctP [uncultured Cloacibacillus sp.]|uniref:TRAP transporter substrate-binding protein DctP n=1 Tax=uncultured Cloacibacillus sp. TaxID=889794 RepID=UPI001F85DF3D|nr:TRAP transporter substrate-binding protein DctP [uncultured Cloacibacillus sp.]HIR16985.1 TRAP transporter substrate-binding protein DctP [Candidatus Caccocola faecigallinarum]